VLSAAGAVARTYRKQIFVSLLSTALIAIVAMLLGVQILWSDDWTWAAGRPT